MTFLNFCLDHCVQNFFAKFSPTLLKWAFKNYDHIWSKSIFSKCFVEEFVFITMNHSKICKTTKSTKQNKNWLKYRKMTGYGHFCSKFRKFSAKIFEKFFIRFFQKFSKPFFRLQMIFHQ